MWKMLEAENGNIRLLNACCHFWEPLAFHKALATLLFITTSVLSIKYEFTLFENLAKTRTKNKLVRATKSFLFYKQYIESN